MNETTKKVPIKSNKNLIDQLITEDGKAITPAPPQKREEQNTMQKEHIENLPLTKLTAFESHPFQVKQDEDFQKLVESIKENGVLIPAIARAKGDSYELIAGHRRKFACQILGIEAMPVLVREMTNEQAVIAMVDSNVQRENILPSEKAFAYKMKLEALNRQLGRPAEKEGQVVPHYLGKRSTAIVAENSGESYKQVQRYIRLTELIPQLLQMVDERKIAFNPAVELSHLPKEQQLLLLSAMEAEQSTPSLSQAQRLKALSSEGKFTEDSAIDVMREQKGNQQEQIKLPYDKIRTIIKKDMNPQELTAFILRAVEDYQKKLVRQQQSRDSR
jgi:ParB family chromosome partitioning protein